MQHCCDNDYLPLERVIIIPALKAYPDAIIVTADDYIYYPTAWLEVLYRSYLKNPDCIHCHRATKFLLDNQHCFSTITGGKDRWPFPSYLNKLTGCGGVLYPPDCFHPDVTDSDLFMQLAPTSDDIWFWLMAAMAGYKVKVPDDADPKLHYVEGTQDVGLWHINDFGEKLFWQHFNNILRAYPRSERRLRTAYAEACRQIQLEKDLEQTKQQEKEFRKQTEQKEEVFKKQIIQLQEKNDSLTNSRSYRIGRAATWLPRKLRGGIRCYREHGLKYTLIRLGKHLCGKT